MSERSARECFVISPIGEDGSSTRGRSDAVLRMLVAPAADRVGLSVIRADIIAEPGSITDQVIRHLVEAELVVADLTDQNPNVYYELAVRHSFGKPVVLVAQRGEKLPFDLVTERVTFLTLEGPAALASRDVMVDQLEAAMRAALRGHTSPVTRVAFPARPPAAAEGVELQSLIEEVRASLASPTVASELAYLSAEVRFLRQALNAQQAEVEEERSARLRAAVGTAQDALITPLELKVQPIVSLLDGRREGVEVLSRTRLPDGTLLPPIAFLPQIGEAGLLWRWDIRVAGELEKVLRAGVDTDQLGDYVSINCSGTSLQHPEMRALLHSLQEALARIDKRLVVEVSESDVVDFVDDDQVRAVLAQGDLAIDDFGTGYSALAFLRDINARYLKVDRSFIVAAGDNESRVLLHSFVELGRALGLEVVAEGVESAEQARRIRDLGFDSAQGYFFGWPEPLVGSSV